MRVIRKWFLTNFRIHEVWIFFSPFSIFYISRIFTAAEDMENRWRILIARFITSLVIAYTLRERIFYKQNLFEKWRWIVIYRFFNFGYFKENLWRYRSFWRERSKEFFVYLFQITLKTMLENPPKIKIFSTAQCLLNSASSDFLSIIFEHSSKISIFDFFSTFVGFNLHF